MKSRLQQYIKTHGLKALKELCYRYCSTQTHACILDSTELNTGVHGGDYEFIAGFGAADLYHSITEVSERGEGKWLLGALGYDLKNNFEKLTSTNPAIVSTPDFLFFEPKTRIILLKTGEVKLDGELTEEFWQPRELKPHVALGINTYPLAKASYIAKINEIHELIRSGDVYELNYCVPHVHSFVEFSPIRFQLDLLERSPVPMANYLKADHLHLCGASMERYLLKKGNKLISQPIKGTIKKGKNPQEDEALIQELTNSTKDRAENVMIVDLVRNDLNRLCERGSVNVSELFGIYSYLQVHQMISTVEGTLKTDTTLEDILKASFPMGSMTGAPKIAAMLEIERLESFKRGWYSGSVGYINPAGDFDFNVVIRSVLCNMNTKTLNYNAGGAITIDSDAENEWDEVQLKTKAITETLGF